MTKTPFHNKKGKIVLKFKPLRDICLIYPIQPKNTMGDKDTILIPEQYKDRYHKPEGVVLAIGPGYYDAKNGMYRKVSQELKPGVKVTFDLNVPWRQTIKGVDGKPYVVVVCTEQDIQCVCEE